MILESVFGVSLLLNVSLDAHVPDRPPAPAWSEVSVAERQAKLRPLVARATACILHRIGDNPRYGPNLRPDEIDDLIAAALRGCKWPLRAMIGMHDRLYGVGSGETFLLGPYLDALPSVVVRQVQMTLPAR